MFADGFTGQGVEYLTIYIITGNKNNAEAGKKQEYLKIDLLIDTRYWFLDI